MKIIYYIIGIFIIIGFVYLYFSNKEPITNYPSSGVDIIAFGDSLVEGVGASSGNDFVSILSKNIGRPIVNLGRSGDTTRDGLLRINQLDNYKPKVVLLLFGGNDHIRKLPIEETQKNLELMIENIQARGAIVFLLGVRGGLLNDPFDTIFEYLRDKYHTAYLSDLLDGIFGNARYLSDVVHPNDIGHNMIAERIYPILIQLLK
ncbi:MAG: GDSL-type esterase/lipase family protein [Patescibacteria group bacterium]